jgi:hypothetical protein
VALTIINNNGSTDLVRTLAASHRKFRNLIKTRGRTPLDEWSARRKGLYVATRDNTTQEHKDEHWHGTSPHYFWLEYRQNSSLLSKESYPLFTTQICALQIKEFSNKLTCSMEQSVYWKANSCSDNQEIRRMFITIFTTAYHWSQSWDILIFLVRFKAMYDRYLNPDPCFIVCQTWHLLFAPALGPTQPPVQWVPGVLSPGIKRGWGVMLTTHPHLVPRSWMRRSYTSSPPKRLHGV